MPVRSDFSAGEFCWIDLMAHDVEAAMAWYGELFGWTHFQAGGDGPPYHFFASGDAGIGGAGQASPEMKEQGVPPHWNNYVAVDDCEASVEKARELGATITVPTIDVPGHGKLAFFLDPQGASCAMWQSTSTEGAGLKVHEHGSLSWNELMVRDVGAAREFYGALFGWEFSEMPMGEATYVMIRKDGKDVAGMMAMDGPQFEGVPPHWMVYFAVDDCDGVAAKVAETGGTVHVPPTEIPVGKFSCVADPQGAAFSLVQTNEQKEC